MSTSGWRRRCVNAASVAYQLTRTPAYYAYLTKIFVYEVTSTVRGIRQEVAVGRREGLARASVANFENIHVVPTVLLGDRIGAVSAEREREVKRALGHALGWAELKVL